MKFYILIILFLLNCVRLDDLNEVQPVNYLYSLVFSNIKSLPSVTTTNEASFQIQGTLKDSSGNPIANATLSLGVSQSIVSREAVTTSTTTDSNGNYTLNLKVGNFSVKVTNSSGAEIGSFRMNATSTSAKPEISATSGNLILIIISISPPSPISPVTPSKPVAPSNLSYPSSSLTLTIGTAMNSLNPTVSGTVSFYSVSPSLPIGLSLNSSTGVLSGTPMNSQVASIYTITASNSGGSSTYLITISTTNVSNSTSPPTNLSYSSSILYLNVGTSVSYLPKISGIVSSYTIIPNNLPEGLSFNTNSGLLSGTPTKINSITTYTILANNNGGSTSFIIQIIVNSELVLIRNWAIFTDMTNGTVRIDVNSGIFGGQPYTAKTLYFAKCSHGQTYDQSSNSCLGSALNVHFCSSNDNSCNGNDSQLEVKSGDLYNACNDLNSIYPNLGGRKSWRVPTKNEMKLLINCNTVTELPNDLIYCPTSPIIRNLFPNTQSGNFWSSSTYSENSSNAWNIFYGSGIGNVSKTYESYVRCISDP